MLIGARVSTDGQTVDLQRDARRSEGCERIVEDMAPRRRRTSGRARRGRAT